MKCGLYHLVFFTDNYPGDSLSNLVANLARKMGHGIGNPFHCSLQDDEKKQIMKIKEENMISYGFCLISY